MQDRRDFPRHSCQVEVVYTISDQEYKSERCIGHNICAGGINLISDRELKEDSLLSMSFILPEEKGPVSLLGRVVWAQNLGEGKYHAGVEFESISISDQAKIISFVVKNEPFIFMSDDPINQ